MFQSIISALKPKIKALTPDSIRRRIQLHRAKKWDAKLQQEPSANIFTAVYRQARWGKGPNGDFYSGRGSHDPELVTPYINAVALFLLSLSAPAVVDLGCGDFNVGIQLRAHCSKYVACDVVPELIERNRIKFKDADVDFRCIDIAQDDLPIGDVVILRQVLQHLSNAQILKVVPKLYRYRFVVLTEHLPAEPDFEPNLDKLTGGGVRLSSRSGVVLTKHPFNLKPADSKVLCINPQSFGNQHTVVSTTLYDLGQPISPPLSS